MKNKRVWIIRIVAIVLAGLMILSVGAVLIQTLALDGAPVTGDSETSKLPIFILVGAVVLIAVCVLIPTFRKKK